MPRPRHLREHAVERGFALEPILSTIRGERERPCEHFAEELTTARAATVSIVGQEPPLWMITACVLPRPPEEEKAVAGAEFRPCSAGHDSWPWPPGRRFSNGIRPTARERVLGYFESC